MTFDVGSGINHSGSNTKFLHKTLNHGAVQRPLVNSEPEFEPSVGIFEQSMELGTE